MVKNDIINRHAEIDALTHFTNLSWDKLKSIYPMLTVIEELPSAERRGSWVGIDDEPCDVWECDRCGHIVERECPPRFCEECGARMEVE